MINTNSWQISIDMFRKYQVLYQGNRSGLRKPKAPKKNSITHSHHDHIDTVFEELPFSELAKKFKQEN